MKLIFLDFDGVLNNKASISMGIHIMPEKVMMINRLVEDTDASIVISSSWRCGWELKDLKEILRITGLINCHKVIGYTPRGHNFTCRGEEIQSVLDANKVISYVILDDDADMLASQQDNFVKTNFEVGFIWPLYDVAKGILNAPLSS